jgi:hypothetical protein
MNKHMRIGLGRRGLFLIATPLFFQAIQVFVLCHLLSRAQLANHLALDSSISSIRICLGIGLTLTVVLFLGSTRAFSSMVVKRVQVMQENIKRVKQGKPLLEPAIQIFGSDELSDLDAEFHELAASMLRQNLPKEAPQLTYQTQHHSSVNAGG